jgi:pimeloyl-ACP methyl ester carboxylesterase
VECGRLEIEGRSVQYRFSGLGSPVVLVHGLSGSWRWWASVFDHLAEEHRVYVLDLPRLGRHLGPAELATWLGLWLRAAGLERVDLVGHSLGGLVAAELAANEPARVRRLALVAPAGIPCGRGVGSRAVWLLGTLYDVRGRLPTIVSDALRAGPLGLALGAAFVSGRDLRGELASVRARSLLVWGRDDRLVPLHVAGEWQRALPGARLVLLPCGHVPMWDVPDELSACLLAFFEEELADDPGDELRSRVVDGVGLPGDDQESPAR